MSPLPPPSPPPPRREPPEPPRPKVKWGDERWYHDVIPVVLAALATALAVYVLVSFMQADW